MNVSAIIVTRGNVPVQWNVPLNWERVLWDNSAGVCRVWHPESKPFDLIEYPVADLSVYGRYAAIEHATHDLIYVQDDDVTVSDPQAIVDQWISEAERGGSEWVGGKTPFGIDGEIIQIDFLCANMPQEFRHDGYTDSCLVGFGACFHRDLPKRAFGKFVTLGWSTASDVPFHRVPGLATPVDEHFLRTCDVVFTTLTPRVLVDVPKTDREFASDADRMWRQPDHYGERVRMLELARKVRDA